MGPSSFWLSIAVILFGVNRLINCQLLQNDTNKSPIQPLSSILAQELGETISIYGNPSGNEDTLARSVLKTYVRTNNMRAYHLDLHSYRSDAKFVGDPSFVNSTSDEHKLRCAIHLGQYEKLLKSFNELNPVHASNSLESMRLADTYGRPEAGVLLGNQFWLGSYDSCLDFKLEQQDQTQSVQAHYCLGLAQFPNWNPAESKTSVKVGLCLPETCTSSMINENPELLSTVEKMMKYQFGAGQPYGQLTLREVYCLPHETSEIRQYSRSAIYFFLLMGAFVTANVIATTIDYCSSKLPENLKSNERSWRTIIIESFSLKKNLEKFLYIRENSTTSIDQQATGYAREASFNRSTFFNTITGLKCIGLFWIICGHTFLVSPITNKNILYADKLTQTYLANIYLSAHLLVDTFFALSGLLASFFLFKEGAIGSVSTKGWIVLTLHRYWRLTPIYLLSYWFTKSVGFLVNSGPMWDYMTAEQSPRLNCNRESWTEAILHLSDFKSPKEHCVPFAWFIANGIKFWMVTPIYLMLIYKSMRRGYMVVMGTVIANIVLVTVLAMRSDVDMKSLIEFKPESADNILNNMTEVYTRPYSRISPYLIGLVAGHLVYLIDTNKLEVNLSKNTKTIIWTLFSITTIVMVFVVKIANGLPLEDAAVPWVFGITTAVIRPLWALCTCWLVFALAQGQAKWLANFLSAKCWRVIVKLSFCAYLAQGEVIAQLYLSAGSADSFNYIDLICRPIVVVALTCAVSFIMVLLIEYPLCGIEELVLPKRTKVKGVSPAVSDDCKNKGEKLKCT